MPRHQSRRWAGRLAALTVTGTILAFSPLRADASTPLPRVSAAAPAIVTPSGHGMGAIHTSLSAAPGLPAPASASAQFAAAALPARVDLSAYDPKVGDQGRIGSCTTWAIVYGMMGWFAKRSGHSGAPFAPMYAYSQVNGGSDNGSSPVDVLDLLSTQGADSKADYPHPSTDWKHHPNSAERASAAKNKIAGYVSVFGYETPTAAGRAAALKAQLAAGRPVALGIEVYSTFQNATLAHPVVRGADIRGKDYGGHEILAVGYNTTGVQIMNSWGTGWGKHGYATLDWKYLAKEGEDAYTMAGFNQTSAAGRPTITSMTPSVLPTTDQDSQITITGTNLAQALVKFQGEMIRPDSVDGDGQTLSFTAPGSDAGTFKVQLSTPIGTSLSSPASSVRFLDPPEVDDLTPAEGPVAGGTLVTVSGSGLAEATQVTLDGVDVAFTVVGDEALTFTTPPGEADICAAVDVTAPGGSTDGGCFEYLTDD